MGDPQLFDGFAVDYDQFRTLIDEPTWPMLANLGVPEGGRGLDVGVYIAEMFSTGDDRANRAAVRAVARDALDLVGIAVHGPRNAVDRSLKGAQLHP